MILNGLRPRGAVGLLMAAFAVASPAQGPTASTGRSAIPGFVQNVGGWSPKASFLGRGSGVSMWLGKSGVTLDYARPADSTSKFLGHAIGMELLGAKPLEFAGAQKRGFVDSIRRGSVRRGAKFARASASAYPGVDFVAYFDGATPRYDFVVKPGADPRTIRLAFRGAGDVRVADARTLALGTAFGERKVGGLFAYQNAGGVRRPVEVAFVKNARGEVSFSVGSYDRSKALVIDPLIYGTYVGGDNGYDEVRAVTTDATGGTFITGYTRSAQYPINFGPYGFNQSGGRDAFMTKLQGDVYNNDYSAYIGGSGNDQGNFLDTDSFGNVWVLGSTTSTNFPGGGSGPMWLMRFAPDPTTVLTPFRNGSPVLYRFGRDSSSPAADSIQRIVGFGIPKSDQPDPLLPTKFVFGGMTGGRGFDQIAGPVLSPAFYLSLQYSEGGAFSVNQAASGFIRVSGGAAVTMNGLAVNRKGSIFMSGSLLRNGINSDTSQANPVFDTTPLVFPNGRLQRFSDIWVRRLDPSGAIRYSALLGGSADDVQEGFIKTRNWTPAGPRYVPILDYTGTTIAADENDNAYLLGKTVSFDFPRTRGVFGEIFTGSNPYLTVTKIAPEGTEILYSTNVNNRAAGGRGVDAGTGAGISVDPRGQVYITGTFTRAMSFPVTPGEPPVPDGPTDQPAYPSEGIPTTPDAIRPNWTHPVAPEITSSDAFFMAIKPDASALAYSTYIGGLFDDGIFAPYTDRFGDTFTVGWLDTQRSYALFNSMGMLTNQFQAGVTTNLNGFITNFAFKQNPDSNPQSQGTLETNVAYGAFEYAGSGGGQGFPQLLSGTAFTAAGVPYTFSQGVRFARDGYLLRWRLSLPVLTSLTLNPAVLPGGDPTGGTSPTSAVATLTLSSPAPEGGASVILSLDNASAASFDPSSSVITTTVTVPAGATTRTFTVYTRPVPTSAAVAVRADYSGSQKVASLTVLPWLQSLTISPTTIISGNTVTGVVKLQAVAPNDVVVYLSSNPTGVTFGDNPYVIVPKGSDTATFTITAPATDVTKAYAITAALLNATQTRTLTVNPARLSRIELNPATVAGGSEAFGTVFLDGKTASDRIIRLSVAGNPAGYRFEAVYILIPAGSDRGVFGLFTPFEPTTVTRSVQAIRVANDQSSVPIEGPVSATLTVQAVSVASVTVSPSTVPSGGTATVRVSIVDPAPSGGAIVQLVSDNPGLFQVPATIVIPQGQTTATVIGTAGNNLSNANASTTVAAYRGTRTSSSPTASVTVTPLTASLTIAPSTVFGGETATGTVSIAKALGNDATVYLSSSDPAVTVPATVTLVAGQTSVSFPINSTTVDATKTVTITAQVSQLAPVSAQLTVRSVSVASISLSRYSIRAGQTTRLTVTLDAVVTRDTVIPITLSNGTLISFPQVVVPAGSSSATVTSFPASRVPRTLSTSITASLGGNSASTVLTVTR